MVYRRAEVIVAERLTHLPAVALLGPRQSGKTTLARNLADQCPSLYLDLESPVDRQKLSDPVHYLTTHQDKLIVIDEIQHQPELFQVLRGLIDDGRRQGRKHGRFLVLGSASPDLLRQSESLAGRIAYIELDPFDVLELPHADHSSLWLRGGFPESFLAADEYRSIIWRRDFIRTYLERDVPQLGPRIPASTLFRFWSMLAHVQGGVFNGALLGRTLEVDAKTIIRYLDLLENLMLVRRLMPYQANHGKRLVKAPKVFIRDSGIVHALLNITDLEALLGHPVLGASWEGFVIENLICAAPQRTMAYFYRTQAGAEIDLILDIPGHGLWAIEIKRGLSARPEKGFYMACDDLKVSRRFLVNAGTEHDELRGGLEMIGLEAMASRLARLS